MVTGSPAKKHGGQINLLIQKVHSSLTKNTTQFLAGKTVSGFQDDTKKTEEKKSLSGFLVCVLKSIISACFSHRTAQTHLKVRSQGCVF